MRLLKAFKRITLAPGETKIVKLQVAASALGFHDETGRHIIEPGPFAVFAGGDSTAQLSAQFELVTRP